MSNPLPTKAYDLHLTKQSKLPAVDRSGEWDNGWCFGLPPGITPEQWPISEKYGFPLRHAFTLHVPAEYRVKGPEYTAISFFADDQFEECKDAENTKGYKSQNLHPHSYPMTDILGCDYMCIWLTDKEFHGTLCTPPKVLGNPSLKDKPIPGWLTKSSEAYYGPYLFHIPDVNGDKLSWIPNSALESAFPLVSIERKDDPNIGKVPREFDDENAESGYIAIFGPESTKLGLDHFNGRNHFGGTMAPIQGYPPFTPFYVEFNEWFGGFNFGDGVGQVDLQLMQMDWACG